MKASAIDPITASVLESAIHDLKGPASRLRLLTQLLVKGMPAADPDVATLMKHVEDSVSAVDVVAEGLKRYTEIGTRRMEREPMDLSLAVAGAMACLSSQIEAADAQLTYAGLPVVNVDRYLITWLFEELMANALRFAGTREPRIEITSGSGGPGAWFVSVSDDGAGIEAAMADRVFLPFKKLSARGGAGLGLTICREIVERHGGQIWVQPRSVGAELRFFVDAGDSEGSARL